MERLLDQRDFPSSLETRLLGSGHRALDRWRTRARLDNQPIEDLCAHLVVRIEECAVNDAEHLVFARLNDTLHLHLHLVIYMY